jgi:hypothetical protein
VSANDGGYAAWQAARVVEQCARVDALRQLQLLAHPVLASRRDAEVIREELALELLLDDLIGLLLAVTP